MGTYTPYSPMGKSLKTVTFEQMTAILERHTGKPFEVKPPPPKSAKPDVPTELKWKRLSDTSIQSTRGQVILKTLSSDSHDIYIVFSGLSSEEGQVLARFASAQDAKDFCRLLP